MDNTIDLKLRLFGGRPIHAKGYGEITPLTVREIMDFGYTEYLKCLNILTLGVKDILTNLGIEVDESEYETLNVLELLISLGGEEVDKLLEKALSLFLGGEAIIDKDNRRVFIKKNEKDFAVIDKYNYGEIQEVLKWQNYINNFEEKKISEKFNPADEETRRLKEQMDALAKKRDALKAKQKQNSAEEEEGSIDFYDILSAIASKSYGINEINIQDLTVYQVYSKFKRLEIIDQYDISVQSIMAGAKDIKIKHWSSKI